MQTVKADEVADDALWRWMAAMHARGAYLYSRKNLVLNAACASQFALQVDPDGEVSLGSTSETMDALCSVTWERATFYRNLQTQGAKGGDFIGILCKDLNGDGADGDEACTLCVFLPIDRVKMEAFMEAERKPGKLRLRSIRVIRGLPVFATRKPRQEMDLAFDGFAPARKASPARKAANVLKNVVGRGGKPTSRGDDSFTPV